MSKIKFTIWKLKALYRINKLQRRNNDVHSNRNRNI